MWTQVGSSFILEKYCQIAAQLWCAVRQSKLPWQPTGMLLSSARSATTLVCLSSQSTLGREIVVPVLQRKCAPQEKQEVQQSLLRSLIGGEAVSVLFCENS